MDSFLLQIFWLIFMRLGDFFQGSSCGFYWFIFVALEREINWRQGSVLSHNDLVVQSSSAYEPWLLMRQEAPQVPTSVHIRSFQCECQVSSLTTRSVHLPMNMWRTLLIFVVPGKGCNLSKPLTYYTLSCGTHVPRPVTQEVIFV